MTQFFDKIELKTVTAIKYGDVLIDGSNVSGYRGEMQNVSRAGETREHAFIKIGEIILKELIPYISARDKIQFEWG